MSLWIGLPLAFLAGLAVGVMALGFLIGKLLDLLVDGLSLNLVDDLQRRFAMHLINEKYEDRARWEQLVDESLAHFLTPEELKDFRQKLADLSIEERKAAMESF